MGGGSRTKALSIQVLGKYQIPENVKIALYCNLLACYEVLRLNSYDLEGCYKACCKKDSNSLDLVPSPKQKKAGTWCVVVISVAATVVVEDIILDHLKRRTSVLFFDSFTC